MSTERTGDDVGTHNRSRLASVTRLGRVEGHHKEDAERSVSAVAVSP